MLPRDVTRLARLRAAVTALAPGAGGRGETLAGLADGSVWQLGPQTDTASLLRPSGASITAIAASRSGVLVVDADRHVETLSSAGVIDTLQIPARAGRAGRYYYGGGPPRPVLACGAIAPSGRQIAVAIDDRDYPPAHELVLFDLDARALVGRIDLHVADGDDCFQIDHVAFDASGTRLAASMLGVRYTYDGDWAWGQDQRVLELDVPSGTRRVALDVGHTSRPSEHEPIAIGFAGDRLLIGSIALLARHEPKLRERELPDAWRPTTGVAFTCGSVVAAEGSATWIARAPLDEAPMEPLSAWTAPAAVTALAADPDAPVFYLGLADGSVLAWRA